MEPEELKSIAPKTATEMQIEKFSSWRVDPVYFETSYYVVPEDAEQKAYALLYQSLQVTGLVAVAQLAMHSRGHVIILRPGGKGLIAHTMFFSSELRADEEYTADTKNGHAEGTRSGQNTHSFARSIVGACSRNSNLAKRRNGKADIPGKQSAADPAVAHLRWRYSVCLMDRRSFVSTLLASTATADLLAQSQNRTVKRVLVMFKCHLDVGFVDTQAAIIRKYFDQYYPRAIALASTMRDSGPDRYVWTTGSWLLYSYLQQASPEQIRRMEQAIIRGDIAWHALPFTWQSELLDRSAMTGCIGFSKALDKRFDRQTTGAKMTDVPGHTRGLIGPLVNSGITFLDIGVNAASTPPDVPPLFVWKDVDGALVTVMYHRTGYGGVVRVPASDLAIAVEVRDDNSGPHTLEEVHKIYSDLRAQYPGADVRAANLTEIANAIQPYRSQLPVFTQEIGDTWIYGVASDPIKLARYRELLRLRAEWVTSGAIIPGDKQDLDFLQKFALAVEHTWGTDTKTWLDFNHYTPAALASMLHNPKYQTVIGSWIEKRKDIEDGVAALSPALRHQAEVRLATLIPAKPDLAGLTQLTPGQILDTKRFRLGFDPITGAITHLENKHSRQNFASQENSLALFTYQTLSKADYDHFLASYITVQTDWAPKDFGKPNIESFGARSQRWNSSSTRIWYGQISGEERVIVELAFDAQSPDAVTAWPASAYLTVNIPDDEAPISLAFSWFEKRANRLPEALWLSFRPIVTESRNWTMSKVERPVSPFDVVSGGNRHMHALTGPLTYRDNKTRLSIQSFDAGVVSLGVMSPISFSNEQPDLTKGFHYSLFNNAWGTNYIQWFGENARFRFRLSLA